MTDATTPLTCRCAAQEPCLGRCGYLCARLPPELVARASVEARKGASSEVVGDGR